MEIGSHADLLAANGLYRRLYEMQFSREEEANGSTIDAATSIRKATQ